MLLLVLRQALAVVLGTVADVAQGQGSTSALACQAHQELRAVLDHVLESSLRVVGRCFAGVEHQFTQTTGDLSHSITVFADLPVSPTGLDLVPGCVEAITQLLRELPAIGLVHDAAEVRGLVHGLADFASTFSTIEQLHRSLCTEARLV